MYPRLVRAAAVRAPPNPVCLDAAAYSPGGGRDHTARLYGDVAMAVRLYARPRQTVTVFCAAARPGNVEGVARAVEKLGEASRRRVRVAVRGSPGAGADAIRRECERAWQAFHTAELQEVRVGYVLGGAHPDAQEFAAQLRAIAAAHATGHIAFVGLAVPAESDLCAARAVLCTAGVQIELAVVDRAEAVPPHDAWAPHPPPELFAYDQAVALARGVAHVSASHFGYVHMRNWAAAAFVQPPLPAK